MTQKPLDRIDESLIALRRILRATELYERDLAAAAGGYLKASNPELYKTLKKEARAKRKDQGKSGR